MIEALPEPTKSIVTLMVVGSLRIWEVAALRWERIHPDRIEVVESVSTKANSTIRRRMLVAVAFRSILLESCAVFCRRRGRGQNIAIRAIWSSPMQKEAR